MPLGCLRSRNVLCCSVFQQANIPQSSDVTHNYITHKYFGFATVRLLYSTCKPTCRTLAYNSSPDRLWNYGDASLVRHATDRAVTVGFQGLPSPKIALPLEKKEEQRKLRGIKVLPTLQIHSSLFSSISSIVEIFLCQKTTSVKE